MSGFFVFLTVVAILAFVVGMIKPSLVVFWSKKKSRGFVTLYLVAFFVFIIIAGTTGSKSANIDNSTSSSEPQSSISSPVSSQKTAPVSKNISLKLSSGYYTVGTDIPSGTYSFTAVSGSGNVLTNDGSINEIMGVDGSTDTQKTFNNADLTTTGSILEISDVTLKITSTNASGTLAPRAQSIKKSYQFGDGNYVAGKDFTAGTYDLKAIKGSGNVTDDDSDEALNAIMGVENNGQNVPTYMHVKFPSGTKLTIQSGVTISMTPSK